MIQTKQELLNVLNANRDKILSFGVERLGLFGSFVRDEANEKSDVDFVVEFKPESNRYKNLSSLYDFLEVLTERKIEVISKDAIKSKRGLRILSTAQYVI